MKPLVQGPDIENYAAAMGARLVVLDLDKVWTDDDIRAAWVAGFRILQSSRSGWGCYSLLDGVALRDSEVVKRAAEGSDIHRRALALIAALNIINDDD